MRKFLVVVCLVTACWQGIPLPSTAEERSRPITLWPLIYHRADQDRAETDILWPILRYERQHTWTRYALRPFLFSTESDPEKNYRKTSVLWPLSIYQLNGPWLSFHIFPVYWYGRSPESRYNVVFPIYWNGEGPGYSYFHLWPLFGINRKGEGFLEYSTLYPFFRYGSSPRSGEVNLHAPWPVVGFERRSNFLAHHFLPLYSYERGPGHSEGFIFPYYWRKTTTFTARGVPPLWYSSRGSNLKTDLVLPFYFDRETPQEHLRFITPLYFSRQTETRRLNTFIPFFLNYETPKERLRLITPLYFNRQTLESSLSTWIPLYVNYERQDFGLQIGLPVYVGYQSGPFSFSSFFPIYYHARDTQQRSAFTYYFPLYGSYQRGEAISRHFILFPLYSKLWDEGLQLKAWDVIWPLFHYESSPSTFSVRLLPFYWHTHTPQYSLQVGVPLYWSFSSKENSYWHLLPFYGIHRSGGTYTKRFLLGPVFMDTRDTRTGYSRQDVLFPFFSRMKEGEEERSWLIPLYYHHRDSDSRLTLVLVPPYYYHEEPGEKSYHLWPIYGRWQQGSYREHSVLWPLFSFGSDPQSDRRLIQVPLFYQKREQGYAFTTLYPLWWRDETPRMMTDTSLFLHWYNYNKFSNTTQMAFLWLIPPEISLFKYERQPGLVRHSIFPVYSYESNQSADALHWSFLWLLFSYRSQGEYVQQTGFLWKVITYEQRDAQTSDFRFLWRIVHIRKTKDSSTFEFNPLYYYESEEGKGSYWAILGGFIGVETTQEHPKKLRLLWIL